MAKETAEQKLLRLIQSTESQESGEGQQASPVAPEAQQVFDAVKSVGIPQVEVPSFVAKIIAVLKNPSSITQGTAALGLGDINKILSVSVVLVVVFFVTDFVRNMSEADMPYDFALGENIPAVPENLLPTFKDIAQYVDVVSRRNIFQPYERKVAKEEVVDEELIGIERIAKQTENLKLVGISWLDTPESASAMVENTTTGITHFLRKDEKINDVTVQAIYADSIMINFQGEEMELRL